MQASATGVRSVTSSTRTPPSTNARAIGTACCDVLQHDHRDHRAEGRQFERVVDHRKAPHSRVQAPRSALVMVLRMPPGSSRIRSVTSFRAGLVAWTAHATPFSSSSNKVTSSIPADVIICSAWSRPPTPRTACRPCATRRRCSCARAASGVVAATCGCSAMPRCFGVRSSRLVEHRPAQVHGWHRALRMASRVNRGTPERPGLVFALMSGGSCHGAVYRIARSRAAGELERLWQREMPTGVYDPRWLACRTPRGVVQALAFTLSRRSPQHTGRLRRCPVARDPAPRARPLRHARWSTCSKRRVRCENAACATARSNAWWRWRGAIAWSRAVSGNARPPSS